MERLRLPGGGRGSFCDTLVTAPAVAGMPAQDLYQCDVYIPAPSGYQPAVLSLSTTAVGSRRGVRHHQGRHHGRLRLTRKSEE
ncbi:hypothetical protein RCO28_05865 [Streptomyces sp. LHD-70]|uniref:hypothetical protein n=1 Tax=Streptomyces sp. LHD-70 TaxID=3072140 RepID=UPI00280E7EC4|nr:hypothetical protein [Streptomyces sp. LHD-70]MDQ8702017.1 hypothetical protein [Streptomyces sp. LHD-70]